MNDKIIASLDIGSNFIRVIVCERDDDGVLQIIGSGIRPSTGGLRKGVVVNIEATQGAVAAAIEDAEMMSGHEITECWTGIGGNHINGLNSRGVGGISRKRKDSREREISQEDIDKVIETARAIVLPTDREILEVIPQSFIVDDQKGIRHPLDMIGVRLECDVHIITCSKTGAQNLANCVNRAGFRVNELILQTLAAGSAVLTQDEMDLGVVLVDLGGGTTDVLVYVEGTPYSTYTIPAGGTQVTNDISILKNISYDNAEKIKISAGCCWESMLEDDESVLVPGVGGRAPLSIPRSQLMKIIKPRMEEIFVLIKQHLDTLNPPRPFGGGVVLTGGGAELAGVCELANYILRLPSRIGAPIPVKNLSGLVDEYKKPSYAGVIGLILEGEKRSQTEKTEYGYKTNPVKKKQTGIFSKIKSWFKEFT